MTQRAKHVLETLSEERSGVNAAVEEVVIPIQSEVCTNKMVLRMDMATDLPSIMGEGLGAKIQFTLCGCH